MYSGQGRGGPRKGHQRFSMAHASRETRFAAVKAALRKQSLTFEPYSEEVVHALWDELQERHGQGMYCMLRKGLQNALLARLARPLDDGRMSKNKVNKIFQVLIRSCFVLHSRGGCVDDAEEEDERSQHTTLSNAEPANLLSLTSLGSIGSSDWRPGAHGACDSSGTCGHLSPDDNCGAMRNATSESGGVETPGPTRPFALGDWQSIGVGAGVELQQGDSVVGGGFDSGHEEQSIHQTSPSANVTWTGYSWARAAASPSHRRGESADSDLTLTPEERRVFTRTGILPSGILSACSCSGGGGNGGDSGAASSLCDGVRSGSSERGLSGCVRLLRESSEGTTPGTAFSYPTSGSERDVLRRLNLSPAGAASKKDLRRSVSSEDLLAGLTIRTDRDVDYDEVASPRDGGAPRIIQSAPTRSATALGTTSGGGEGSGGGAKCGSGDDFCGVAGVAGEEDESAGAVCELREDVGSLEEVILTHNAFIRKVASEAGIRLPTGEWAAFFGYDQPVSAELEAARSRPAPTLPPPESDPLGYMNKEQLYQFRTAWCNRSHPHVEEFCEHAHEEVNHGWLRRNPSLHPYLPKRCARVILPGHGGEFTDECTRGRSCPAAHSLEEIQYHPQAYKSQVCPHGRKCRSRAFCPHAHVLRVGGANNVGHVRSKSVDGRGGAEVYDEGLGCGVLCGRRSRPGTPDVGEGEGSKREEEWQTVGRRGRRAPSPADSDGQAWVPPARVRSRSWSGSENWSPVFYDSGTGSSSREFRRRASGITGLLAALRKRSADVMQPPVKHEELLRTIYSTLRRREPNGCDEKELVGRVFHTSALADKTGKNDPVGPPAAGEGGAGAAGGQTDAPNSHPFSKTKVRGAVTLLKFAQAVRVGRGDTAGQHVLYVAHELPTFSDFVTRHNRHLVEMARELGVDMTPQEWKSLLEIDHSGGLPLPSPSPTNQSESSASSESPANADGGRSAWAAESPTGVHRRPSPCPKPPQQAQRFPGIPLPSPPSRQSTPQSPAHGLSRSLSSSPPMQTASRTDSSFLRRASSDRPASTNEHAMWQGGQVIPSPSEHGMHATQQSQHHPHCQQPGARQRQGTYPQLHSPLEQAPPASSPATGGGGAWAQAGPGGLAQRLQVGNTLRSSSTPPTSMQPDQVQRQQVLMPSPGPGGNIIVSNIGAAMNIPPAQTQSHLPVSLPPPSIGIPAGYGMSQGQHAGGGSPFLGHGLCSSPIGYGLSSRAGVDGSDGGGGGGVGVGAGTGFEQSAGYPTFAGSGSVNNQMLGSAGDGGTGQASFCLGSVGRLGAPDGAAAAAAMRMRAEGRYERHHVQRQGHTHHGVVGCHHDHPGVKGQFCASASGGGDGDGIHYSDASTSWVGRGAHEHGGGCMHGHERGQQHHDQQRQQQQQQQASEAMLTPPYQQHQGFGRNQPHPSRSAPGPLFVNTDLADPNESRSVRHSGAEQLISRDLRRQSSLPPLFGAQPILTPARMAQTPPAAMSRLARNGDLGLSDFLSVGGPEEGPDADAAAAAAAVAAGGAAEEWERQRARLSSRGTSPAESRIAAAAAVQKAAEQGAAQDNQRPAAVLAGAGTKVHLTTQAQGRGLADAGVGANLGGPGTAAARRGIVMALYIRERNGHNIAGRETAGGNRGGDVRDFALGEPSGQGDGAQGERPLPGLSDLVPSGPRYNLF